MAPDTPPPATEVANIVALTKKMRDAVTKKEKITVQSNELETAKKDYANINAHAEKKKQHAEVLRQFHESLESYLQAKDELKDETHTRLRDMRKALPAAAATTTTESVPNQKMPEIENYEQFKEFLTDMKDQLKATLGKDVPVSRMAYWGYRVGKWLARQKPDSWIRKIAEKVGLKSMIEGTVGLDSMYALYLEAKKNGKDPKKPVESKKEETKSAETPTQETKKDAPTEPGTAKQETVKNQSLNVHNMWDTPQQFAGLNVRLVTSNGENLLEIDGSLYNIQLIENGKPKKNIQKEAAKDKSLQSMTEIWKPKIVETGTHWEMNMFLRFGYAEVGTIEKTPEIMKQLQALKTKPDQMDMEVKFKTNWKIAPLLPFIDIPRSPMTLRFIKK